MHKLIADADLMTKTNIILLLYLLFMHVPYYQNNHCKGIGQFCILSSGAKLASYSSVGRVYEVFIYLFIWKTCTTPVSYIEFY